MGILSAKNMLSFVAVAYAGIAIVSAFTEFSSITRATENANSTISLAADMALSQVVASDEFLNNRDVTSTLGDKYDVDGVTTVKTYNFGWGHIKGIDKNIFGMVYGGDIGNSTDGGVFNNDSAKKSLYRIMYGANSSDFAKPEYLRAAMQITTTINDKTIPNIARLGLLDDSVGGESMGIFADSAPYSLVYETLNNQLKFTNAYDPSFTMYNTKNDWMGLFNAAKEIDSYHKNQGTYFLAPTNVGVTYVDRNLLETAFVSNMDLLMRASTANAASTTTSDCSIDRKYPGIGIPESSFDGEASVVTKEAYKVLIDNNVINDGTFAFVKGTLNNYNSGDGTGGWSGGGYLRDYTETPDGHFDIKMLTPRIEYKVIDMADTNNADIVRLAIGIPGGTSYEEYLNAIGIEVDSTTGKRPSTPIMVARITFYADIIIPYSSWIGREYYSMIERDSCGDKSHCFFQIHTGDAGSDARYSTLTGNQLYEYTTYYAVAP